MPSLILRFIKNLIAQIKGTLLYLENIGETRPDICKLSPLTHVPAELIFKRSPDNYSSKKCAGVLSYFPWHSHSYISLAFCQLLEKSPLKLLIYLLSEVHGSQRCWFLLLFNSRPIKGHQQMRGVGLRLKTLE